MIDVSNYENPTEEEQEQHLKELKELCDHTILDGDIYLKLYCGTVIGATTDFDKAYNWFYDDECNIEVWNNDASFIIDNEEILDTYKQLGFNYTLGVVTK